MNTLFLGGANMKVEETENLVPSSKNVDFGQTNKFVGVSTRLSSAEANCYPEGNCSDSNMVGNYTLFAKQYSVEDSIVLRALSVYGSKMLEGDYITVITNVKDKQPIYRDEVNVSYKSSANGGKSGTSCGPWDPASAIDIITDKCIHTFFLYMEIAVCYKSLVGSFQQRLLQPGQLGQEDNDALNNRILDEAMRHGARQTDRLIWKGDQGSANDDLCHYDGLVKKTFQAGISVTYHALQFNFAGTLGATEFFQVRFGGQVHTEPFDTDTVTTISNLTSWIASQTDATSSLPLATASFNGVDELIVTSNFRRYELEINIQSTTSSSSTIGCKDTGGVTVEETVLQAFKVGDEPLLTPYTNITSANVLIELEKVYIKAATESPDLVTQDDFVIHVAPSVWAKLKVASVKLTGAFSGINGNMENPMPFGMMIVEQPGLQGTNIIFGTRSSNIFFGTDLVSDMTNTETWINKECQEVRMRHETRQGVQIDRYDEIVANLDGAPFSFKPAQQEDCKATSGTC